MDANKKLLGDNLRILLESLAQWFTPTAHVVLG